MKDSREKEAGFPRARLRFPEDEGRFRWLPMLLEAYAMVDTGVEAAIREREGGQGLKLACRRGCGSCCRSQTDVPLYPLELAGIYWYAAEKITGAARAALKERLLFFAKDRPCPFLIEGACSIHPMRPVSCRQFNVFGSPCGEGEDPYFTRRGDVLAPPRELTLRAFGIMLPFYGIKGGTAEDAERVISGEARNLKSVDWKRLYKIMEDFEAKNPGILR